MFIGAFLIKMKNTCHKSEYTCNPIERPYLDYIKTYYTFKGNLYVRNFHMPVNTDVEKIYKIVTIGAATVRSINKHAREILPQVSQLLCDIYMK